MRRSIFLSSMAITAVGLLTGSLAQASDSLDTHDRVQLQAAMQLHIDRHLVDGRYHHLNLATGIDRPLLPIKGHPMIVQAGAAYVMCSDFRDASGQAVNIDFYLLRKGKGFVVFQVEVDRRASLTSLVQNGLARMVD